MASQLSKDRYYYLGKIDIQKFPENEEEEEKQKPKKQKNISFQQTSKEEIAQSVYVDKLNELPDKNQEDFQDKQEDQPYVPQDLGIELYNYVKEKFQKKNLDRYQTRDFNVLFDYWKQLRKQQIIKMKQELLNPKKKIEAKVDPNLTNEQLDIIIERKKKQDKEENLMKTLATCRIEDVEYTIKLHSSEDQQDENVSQFFIKRQKEIQEQDQEKKKMDELKKKDVNEIVNRLYKQKTQAEGQTQVQKSQINEEEKQFIQEKFKRQAFVQTLIIMHKKEFPNVKSFRDKDSLLNYWKTIEDKEKLKMVQDEQQAEIQINLFFNDLVQEVHSLIKQKNGYDCYRLNELMRFWDKTLIQEEKQRYVLDFEDPKQLEKLLENDIKEHEQDIERQKKQDEEKKKEEEEKNKSKIVKQEKFEVLSKPKDRYKLGKDLLNLKKLFPHDKILRKMILQEFQQTRMAKLPQEYDVFDSDEENRIKERRTKDPQINKDTHIIGLEELVRPQKEKEEELAQMFINQIEKYYSDKNADIKKAKEQHRDICKQRMLLRRDLEKRAKQFIEFRKRRFEERVPTLNQFLSQTYHELLKDKQYKQAIVRDFRHFTHGESKRLRKISFPQSFKRYFFDIVRSFLRDRTGAGPKDQKKKLPFWAPPSNVDYMKNNELQKYHTQNIKVQKLSKVMEEIKILQTRPSTSLWDHLQYQKERTHIMMTFKDAQECTFQPAICTRLPERKKQIMRHPKLGYNWLDKVIEGKPGSFEKWIENMGENFKTRYPRIYKFGVLKRCFFMIKKQQFSKAFSTLQQNFKIEQIRKHFEEDKYKVRDDPDSMYSLETLGIKKEDVDKMPNEDFENKANINFLRDVYNMTKYLEEYEENLKQVKKEVNRMILFDGKEINQSINKSMNKSGDQDSMKSSSIFSTTTYASRRNQAKSFMCPLGKDCPSYIGPRWPSSDTKSIIPMGAKCEFAHTYAELRFKAELVSRKKIMKDFVKALDKRLGGQQDIKPWNPGGGIFTECIGCGEQLGSHTNKGVCCTCDIKKKMMKKINYYHSRAELQLKKKGKKLKEKNLQKKIIEQTQTKKIGILQKANTLYKQERFSEAFKVISQVIEMVKSELQQKTQLQKTHELNWKKKLGINQEVEVTPELIFQTQSNKDIEQMNEEEQQLHAQSLYLLGTKIGVIGEKQLNMNEFLNRQIELCYLKIESALEHKGKDIEMMKQKIENLEEGGEDQQKKQANKTEPQKINNKLCPEIKENGKCKQFEYYKQQLRWKNEGWGDLQEEKIELKCPYAHTQRELDLINNEQKITNLQKTIKYIEHELIESKKPEPIRPPSAQSSILDINSWQQKERERMLKNPKSAAKLNKKKDKAYTPSIWEKDVDDLTTQPNERAKKK